MQHSKYIGKKMFVTKIILFLFAFKTREVLCQHHIVIRTYRIFKLYQIFHANLIGFLKFLQYIFKRNLLQVNQINKFNF